MRTNRIPEIFVVTVDPLNYRLSLSSGCQPPRVKPGGFNAGFFDELYPLYDGPRFAPATPSLTKLGLGLVLDELVMHRSAF